MSEQKKVMIELTGDEALVLHSWLTRFNSTQRGNFQDQAEQRVLWDIEASLETALVAPFAPNYSELLEKAREQVRDSED
jgi:hypothetical protein